MFFFFFLMTRRPPRSTLTDTLFPDPTLFRSLFKNICQACHGPDGKGIQSMAPPLNRSEWVTGDKHRLTAIVLFGLTGPVEVHGHVYDQDDITGEMRSEERRVGKECVRTCRSRLSLYL